MYHFEDQLYKTEWINIAIMSSYQHTVFTNEWRMKEGRNDWLNDDEYGLKTIYSVGNLTHQPMYMYVCMYTLYHTNIETQHTTVQEYKNTGNKDCTTKDMTKDMKREVKGFTSV